VLSDHRNDLLFRKTALRIAVMLFAEGSVDRISSGVSQSEFLLDFDSQGHAGSK